MKRKVLSIFFALVLVLSFSLVTAVPVAAAPVTQTGSTIAVTSLVQWPEQTLEAFNAEPHTTVVDDAAFDAQSSSQVIIEGEVSGLTLGAGWPNTAYVEIGLRPDATKDDRNAGIYLIAFNRVDGNTIVHLQDYTGHNNAGSIVLAGLNTSFRYVITLTPNSATGNGGTADLLITDLEDNPLGTNDDIPYGHASSWVENDPGALNEDFSNAHLFYSIIADRRGVAGETYSATVGAITIDDTLYVGAGQQFTTIQSAIDFANPGDTISVAAGTYELSTKLSINKPLSLLGPNVGINPNTEIRVDEAVLTPGEGWDYAGISIGFDSDVAGVIIDGFKFDGFTEPSVSKSGRTIDIAYGTNIVSDITITNNWITNGGHGVYSAKGVSNLFVTDNKFTSLTTDFLVGSDFWSAVLVFHSSGGVISGNVIDGTRSSGVLLYDDANFVVSGNTISNTPNAGIVVIGPMDDLVIKDNIIDATATDETVDLGPDGVYELGGITLADQFGDGDTFTGTVTVTGNTVTNSFNGLSTICIGVGTSLADWSHVNYNNFSDGVTHSGAGTLDALYNWWGDETGPYHATTNPGVTANMGNAVSDNVDFSPWLYKTQESIVPTKEPAYAQSVVLDNFGTYGWNTFSTPIVLSGLADIWVDLVSLTGLNYSVAYRFDSAMQEFVPLLAADDYAITPGEGFFIKMNSAGSLPILYSAEMNLAPPSRTLTVGFNLIGLAGLESMDVDDALLSLAGEGQIVSPSGNESPGAVLAGDTVYVGEAYWAYMLSEETLVGFTTTPFNWVP